MGCIYLLMMKNILNLMFYWIHEFLSWEDHTQALWYKTLCTISQGQKNEQATQNRGETDNFKHLNEQIFRFELLTCTDT